MARELSKNRRDRGRTTEIQELPSQGPAFAQRCMVYGGRARFSSQDPTLKK